MNDNPNAPRILVAGSLNMDMTVSLRQLPAAGQTVFGRQFSMAPGGKGANQAVQLARLGSRVTLMGKVGRDGNGRALQEVCIRNGVDVGDLAVDPDAATGTAVILVEQDGAAVQNRIIVTPGANMTLSLSDIAFLEKDIGSYEMVLLQLEIPMEINEQIAAWASAAGVPVMLNPAPAAPLSDALLRHITCLSPNETEAEALTGCTLTGPDGRPDDLQVEKAARQLLDRGAPSVLITLGESGAVLFGHGAPIRTPCAAHVPAVDPTAAGDSFIAAFCHARCIGYGPEAAMDYASRAAAITVSRKGAIPALPWAGEVDAFPGGR